METGLTTMPGSVQIGAFVAFGLGALATFHLYYEVPLRAGLAARASQLSSLVLELDQGRATTETVPQLRVEVDDLERRLGSLRTALTDKNDLAALLRRLHDDAAQSNLVIRSIKPSQRVTRQLHAEWPIELELEGTYRGLTMFFSRLGRVEPIVNISRLEVTGVDQADLDVTISARCVATTFMLIAAAGEPGVAARK